MTELHGRALVLAMCLGQVGNLLPHVVVPAVMAQHLIPLWNLSATQAGVMAGAYAFGYMLAVPVLTALTDRFDARRILLAGSAVSGLATVGFGLFADGLASAIVLWGLAGIGFAGAYMPGLKALTDRLPSGDVSRSVTLYTGSFSVGVGLSFLVSQVVADHVGWRAAFLVTGLGPLLMIATCLMLAPFKPQPSPGHSSISGRCSAIAPRSATFSAMGRIASSCTECGPGSFRSGPSWRRPMPTTCCSVRSLSASS